MATVRRRRRHRLIGLDLASPGLAPSFTARHEIIEVDRLELGPDAAHAVLAHEGAGDGPADLDVLAGVEDGGVGEGEGDATQELGAGEVEGVGAVVVCILIFRSNLALAFGL